MVGTSEVAFGSSSGAVPAPDEEVEERPPCGADTTANTSQAWTQFGGWAEEGAELLEDKGNDFRVFVSNLPPGCSQEHIEEAFRRCGNVGAPACMHAGEHSCGVLCGCVW